MTSCFPEVKRTLSESGPQDTEYTGVPVGRKKWEKTWKKTWETFLDKSYRNSYSPFNTVFLVYIITKNNIDDKTQ